MKPLVPTVPETDSASDDHPMSPEVLSELPPSISFESFHSIATPDILDTVPPVESDDEDSDGDDEEMTDFEQAMEEFGEEETLTHESSGDVALDMDADMMGEEYDEEYEDYDGVDGEDKDIDDEGATSYLSEGEDDT
jgi:hypothetical protein